MALDTINFSLGPELLLPNLEFPKEVVVGPSSVPYQLDFRQGLQQGQVLLRECSSRGE